MNTIFAMKFGAKTMSEIIEIMSDMFLIMSDINFVIS